MKSAKELLEQMGFNKDAPMSLQKAFLKHLQSEAEKFQPVEKSSPDVQSSKNAETTLGLQLAFDLGDTKRVS